jgi:hypothetical protein
VKRLVLGGVTIVVVVWAVAAAVVAERAPGRANDATSAAINAVYGDSPAAGLGASCRYAPDLGMAVLRARYRCEFSTCFRVTHHLELTRDRRGNWTYEVTEGGLPGSDRKGRTSPAMGAVPTFYREDCVGDVEGGVPSLLDSLAGDLVRGRPSGQRLRRALPDLSVEEIEDARFRVTGIDFDEATATVRVRSGRKVRTVEVQRLDRASMGWLLVPRWPRMSSSG